MKHDHERSSLKAAEAAGTTVLILMLAVFLLIGGGSSGTHRASPDSIGSFSGIADNINGSREIYRDYESVAPPDQEGPTQPERDATDLRNDGAASADVRVHAAIAHDPIEAIFPPSEWPTARCIRSHESHDDPNEIGDAGERGWFQIHPSNAARFVGYGGWDMAFDPWVNTKVAYDMWKANQSWKPWTTHALCGV